MPIRGCGLLLLGFLALAACHSAPGTLGAPSEGPGAAPVTWARCSLPTMQPPVRDLDAALGQRGVTAAPVAVSRDFRRRGLEMGASKAGASKTGASGAKDGGGGGDDLAKQVQNPIANLISLPFQNNTGFEMGPHGRSTNTLNIQPVIPVKLGRWLLVNRAILPIVYQPDLSQSEGGWTGTGNLNYTAFFVPPLEGGFMIGVGPILTFPTQGSDRLGADAWGAGPSAVVMTTRGKWVVGCLVNNVWSYAGTDDVSSFLLQPFVNFNLPNQWYVVTAPIITANWKAEPGNKWLVPLGGGLGKIFKVGRQPLNASLQAYYDVWRPEGAPRWQLRLQIQFLFPMK